MSNLKDRIKELKKIHWGSLKALGVVGAMAFSSLGNEAKAETPKTKDSEEVKKEYHMSQEMPSSKLVNDVKNEVDLDSLTTPELLDYLIEIGPKRVKEFSGNETEYSVPFDGGNRVAKVVNSDGSYFYGVSVGKNAGGHVEVNKRDMSCMNGAYSLCIRADGTFYVPDYTPNHDEGFVERTDYERGFNGNVRDTDNELRTAAKKTITTIQRNKENKKTYQLTHQDLQR